MFQNWILMRERNLFNFGLNHLQQKQNYRVEENTLVTLNIYHLWQLLFEYFV